MNASLSIVAAGQYVLEIGEEFFLTRFCFRPDHIEIGPSEVFVAGEDQVDHLAPERIVEFAELAGVRRVRDVLPRGRGLSSKDGHTRCRFLHQIEIRTRNTVAKF